MRARNCPYAKSRNSTVPSRRKKQDRGEITETVVWEIWIASDCLTDETLVILAVFIVQLNVRSSSLNQLHTITLKVKHSPQPLALQPPFSKHAYLRYPLPFINERLASLWAHKCMTAERKTCPKWANHRLHIHFRFSMCCVVLCCYTSSRRPCYNTEYIYLWPRSLPIDRILLLAVLI